MIVKCRLDSLLTENDVSIDHLSNSTGVSVLSIKEILAGNYIPSVYVALLFSVFFGCSVDDIFYLDFV